MQRFILSHYSSQLPRPIAISTAFHRIVLTLHPLPLLYLFALFIVPFLSISAMATFTHTRVFPIHDEQNIDVVYTNDLTEVTRYLDMFESFLQGVEDRFMGLDLDMCVCM